MIADSDTAYVVFGSCGVEISKNTAENYIKTAEIT